MDFSLSERQRHWRDRVTAFMQKHVYPAVDTYNEQMKPADGNRWIVVPVLEDLKKKAKAEGIWNLFLPASPTSNTRSAPKRWARCSSARKSSTAPRRIPVIWKCCTATARRRRKRNGCG